MNNPGTPPVHALPDGGAELQLTLRLNWDDVAALGREAGRLATQFNRSVGLDEAASHRLSVRSRQSATEPGAAEERGAPLGMPGHGLLSARSAAEQSRHALENHGGASAAAPVSSGVHVTTTVGATGLGRGDVSGSPRP
ncbi:hypothetical protein ACFWMG_39685 [Streptomyces sp. NPDC127074]|uniref:hypothetical protein n=1 Tax=Streptomyces sp. NPDC127074 TaxID=3347130 RepID=UPI0036501363